MKRGFIRSVNGHGEKGKVYYAYEAGVIFFSVMLLTHKNKKRSFVHGEGCVFVTKNYYLTRRDFSIKTDTLDKILTELKLK